MSVATDGAVRLYSSPIGLYKFQVTAVVHCYDRLSNLCVYDCGLGKTHVAMATAAMLFEDGLIDHVLVVCEKNKVEEWQADFAKFTALDAALYYGTPAKRAKIRQHLPQVIISTYETARNDAAKPISVPGRKSKKLIPHVLTEALAGKRVLVIYDELTKLGNRGSGLHKAHEVMISRLRSAGECRVLGLTATPIERSPEDFYNLGRILCPEEVGTVGEFERLYVKDRDIFGNAVKFKNLTADDCDSGVIPFGQRMKSVMLRKRKTDPDVIEEFPSSVEEFTYIDLDPRHLEFYDVVRDAFDPEDDLIQRRLFTTMRQIVAHPLSLMHSQGEIGRSIVESVGEEGLRALGSAKTQRLVEYLVPIVHGQGDKVVVFTFFGPSVIPLLRDALEAEGIRCALNYGGLSDAERSHDMALFKQGNKRVLLTSDAGARGINLPEANYVVEYDMALTHANRTQRLNRIHRIDSVHPSVTFQTFIARDTVEEGIARKVLTRNGWSDVLLDDDDPGESFISAADRRTLMARAKRTGRA